VALTVAAGAYLGRYDLLSQHNGYVWGAGYTDVNVRAPLAVGRAVLDLEQPTVSHHLARLRRAGLVRAERQGIWSFFELDPSMSGAARAALDLVP